VVLLQSLKIGISCTLLVGLLLVLLLPAQAQPQQSSEQLFLPLIGRSQLAQLAVLAGIPGEPGISRIDTVIPGSATREGMPLSFSCPLPFQLEWAPGQPRVACPLLGDIGGRFPVQVGVAIGDPTGDLARIDEPFIALWSPDGATLLLSNSRSVELLNIATGNRTVLLTDTVGLPLPQWAPDGRAISNLSAQGLEVIPLDNGEPFTLPAAEGASGHTWSPDGMHVALHDFNTGQLTIVELATRTPTRSETNVQALAWAPDGASIAIVRAVDETSRIELITPTGDDVQDLGPGIGVEWAPDSRSLVLLTDAGGELLDLVAETRFTLEGEVVRSPDWSPDSRTLAYISELNGAVLTLLDVITRTKREVTGLRNAGPLSWSPDGAWLALISPLESNGSRLIIVSRAGGTVRDELYPAFISSFQWLR
jgi:dipeptidyl aminopeptidase/acylaminoacyl peptidase